MRDIENDRIANKNTLVVKFGLKFGLWYQRVLVFMPIILYLLFLNNFKNGPLGFSFLFLCMAISHNNSITKIVEKNSPNEFDPLLKTVALTTFLFAILLSLKIITS